MVEKLAQPCSHAALISQETTSSLINKLKNTSFRFLTRALLVIVMALAVSGILANLVLKYDIDGNLGEAPR